MRDSRQTRLVIVAAGLLIAGSLAAYAALLFRWLKGRSPAPPPPRETPARETPTQALEAARRRFREEALDPASHLRLSEALREAGRPVDAFYVVLFAKGLFAEEDLRAAHGAVVLGRPAEEGEAPAEEALKERLRRNPEDPAALAALARILLARGDAAAAGKYLDFGLSLRPEHPGLLAAKAEAASPGGSLGAVPFLVRLVHAAPESYEGRRALERLGRLASAGDSGPGADLGRLAREGLEELVSVRPRHSRIFTALAMALWERGDLAAVSAMAAEARSRQPALAGAARMEGMLALRDGAADRAVRAFSEAWERDPEDLYSARRLAELHAKQRGDPGTALPYLLALHRRDPWGDEGEPVELSVRSALDARRKAVLDRAGRRALGRYLASDDASLRAEACARAAEAEDPAWLEDLARLLDDDAGIVRHNADYALFRIGRRFPDAVKPRRGAWYAAAGPFGRARVLNLFSDLWPRETYPLVVEALGDPNPALRVLAKTMVLDRYYASVPAAAKAAADYARAEAHPRARRFLARASGG